MNSYARGDEPQPDGFSLLEIARAEAGHLPTVRELLRRLDLAVEGMPFNTALRLPNTPARRQRYQRDKWLPRAASEIDASGWAGCVRLAAELDRFLSRGPWSAWRDRTEPPIDASRLRRALFFVARYNDGNSLDATTLLRMPHVLRAFPERRSSTAPTFVAADNEGT